MKILDADRFYDAVNDIYSHDVISKKDILDLIDEMAVVGNVDMEKSIELFMNEKASVSALEDFLGYQITDVIIDTKEERIREVLLQMTEEKIEAFFNKYCR